MIESLSNRKDYPCLKNNCYLNQASLGLIGETAASAMHHFLSDTARHGNLNMSDADETAFLDATRLKIGRLLNAQPDNIAVVSSASEILSQLPFLIKPRKNKKIVLVETDFPAITRPWIAYSERKSLKLIFVKEQIAENLTDQIIKNLDETTAVVCVSFVQFSSGTRLNILKLRNATKRLGIRLVVDITQAAGVIPISLESWEADLVICSGYKWLGGHGGVAFAIFSADLLNFQPPWIGWFGGENPFELDATRLLLAKTAAKYTQSTMSYISVIGLNAAIDNLLNIGIEKIYRHSNSLATILASRLEGLDWKSLHKFDNLEYSPHIISLNSSKVDIKKKFAELSKNGIICGIRNGRLRISIAHYNNQIDIETLIKQLQHFS